MPQRQTVLVVGAGASSEFRLPTGRELTASISGALNIQTKQGRFAGGDGLIADAIVAHAGSQGYQSYFKAARSTSAAMPLVRSIDEYLDLHAADQATEICGKLAITRLILKAERSSSLSSEAYGAPPFSRSADTWLNQFWGSLVSRCRFDQLAARLAACSIVVFNYDRCIEHFLYHAIQTVYRVKAEDAAATLRHLRIFHPYGTVGSLPWQTDSAGPTIEFGGEVDAHQLNALRQGIRTYSEKLGEYKGLAPIREAVLAANVVVFLGFAFHPDNMALLTPEDQRNAADTTAFYATLLNESKNNIAVVEGRIKALRKVRPRDHEYHIEDLTCVKLFEHYSKTFEFQ